MKWLKNIDLKVLIIAVREKVFIYKLLAHYCLKFIINIISEKILIKFSILTNKQNYINSKKSL